MPHPYATKHRHQARVLPRGWVERGSSERRCDADTPSHIPGAALCAHRHPSASAFAQRRIWMVRRCE
jgi:hypothetical protein